MLKKTSILKLEIISTIFVMILGVLLHFTFEWSNNNVLVSTFSPVNESTWEHLKLVFFPMLITTIFIYFYEGKNISNYLCAKVQGIILAMIGSFFIAVALGQYVAYQKMKLAVSCNKIVPVIVLLVLCLFFWIFTFFTPNIGLFKDPITGMFGI